MSLHPDFISELRRHFSGDIRNDRASRILYSTDASIYQIEPLGVLLPRTQDDLQSAVELAAKYRIPILPRGAGTSLAGQAVGNALILDCSRWLDHITEISPESQSAVVEPGVVLSGLNRAAGKFGLQFGPDPASAERATMGGVIGNNATGAHSILYGMTADHVVSADVILSDGSLATLGEVEYGGVVSSENLYSALLTTAFKIREEYGNVIKSHWPGTWRNSAGYRLNYLLPWSPSTPSRWSGDSRQWSVYAQPTTLNLAPLIAGSEGTLAIIRQATVRLVPKPGFSILAVLSYESIAKACDDVPRLLEHNPSAIELVPQMLIRLARGIPAYASQMGWVSGDPAALLIIEFSGDSPDSLRESALKVGRILTVAETSEEQSRIWNVRKVGLGLLDSRPQSARPVAFIEDCAIPVDHLGEFVREVELILSEHGTMGGIYAHASAGCLHIRPILDLKTASGVTDLRNIAEAVLALTLKLGGAMSSEHGDGLARSEWLEKTYGRESVEAMRLLKRVADPYNLLNPRKILDASKMDEHLRYGGGYRTQVWKPGISFERSGGLAIAIEQCNGQGVCRKTDGVMCPSYQATRDEMHSTRGRANLLRALISQNLLLIREHSLRANDLTESVASALDLCLACKGCKAECPSGVDMARLKHAFEAEYFKSHHRPLRDYIFGYFHIVAGLLAPIAPLANPAMQNSLLKEIAAGILGITPHRPFPKFSRERARPRRSPHNNRKNIIFLSDTFAHFIEPQVEQAAFDILEAAGFNVYVLPVLGAGAALMSKGFLDAARHHAARVLGQLAHLDQDGSMPIVGIEPPEIYTLKNDYVDLLPERESEILRRSENTWMLEEFLIRSEFLKALRVAINKTKVIFHPHCHQHAEGPAIDGLPNGTQATVELLRFCGYEVELIGAGCCGMAGTFGYEVEHYELSQQIGELKLFPAIRRSSGAVIASTGAACRMQIEQNTGLSVEHPIVLAARALDRP